MNRRRLELIREGDTQSYVETIRCRHGEAVRIIAQMAEQAAADITLRAARGGRRPVNP